MITLKLLKSGFERSMSLGFDGDPEKYSTSNSTHELLQSLKRELQTGKSSEDIKDKIRDPNVDLNALLEEIENQKNQGGDSQGAQYLDKVKKAVNEVKAEDEEKPIMESIKLTAINSAKEPAKGLFYSIITTLGLDKFFSDSTKESGFKKAWSGILSFLGLGKDEKSKVESLNGFPDDIQKSIKNFANFPENTKSELNFEFEANFTNNKEKVEPLKKFLENFNRAKSINKENELIKIEDDKFWPNILGKRPLENKFMESIRQKVIGIKKDGGLKLSQDEFFERLSLLEFGEEKKPNTETTNQKSEAIPGTTNQTPAKPGDIQIVVDPNLKPGGPVIETKTPDGSGKERHVAPVEKVKVKSLEEQLQNITNGMEIEYNGQKYKLEIDGKTISIGGKQYNVEIEIESGVPLVPNGKLKLLTIEGTKVYVTIDSVKGDKKSILEATKLGDILQDLLSTKNEYHYKGKTDPDEEGNTYDMETTIKQA